LPVLRGRRSTLGSGGVTRRGALPTAFVPTNRSALRRAGDDFGDGGIGALRLGGRAPIWRSAMRTAGLCSPAVCRCRLRCWAAGFGLSARWGAYGSRRVSRPEALAAGAVRRRPAPAQHGSPARCVLWPPAHPGDRVAGPLATIGPPAPERIGHQAPAGSPTVTVTATDSQAPYSGKSHGGKSHSASTSSKDSDRAPSSSGSTAP
jgi:hypothetical protein